MKRRNNASRNIKAKNARELAKTLKELNVRTLQHVEKVKVMDKETLKQTIRDIVKIQELNPAKKKVCDTYFDRLLEPAVVQPEVESETDSQCVFQDYNKEAISETFQLQPNTDILTSPPLFSSSEQTTMKLTSSVVSTVAETQCSQVDTQDASSNTTCTYVENVFCGANAEMIATLSSSDNDEDEEEKTSKQEHRLVVLDDLILAELATDFNCSECDLLYKIKQIESRVNVNNFQAESIQNEEADNDASSVISATPPPPPTATTKRMMLLQDLMRRRNST